MEGKKMKKNIAMRVASLILMCTIVSSCFVGSTFAKYTSSATGSSTATVAKWSIKLNGNELAVASPTITFNLFSTVLDTKDENAETDVAPDKIAPGTKGGFNFGKIKNESEVNATYEIKLAIQKTSNVPITLTSTPAISSPVEQTIDSVVYNVYTISGTVDMNSEIDGPNITWEWPYEPTGTRTDADDTQLGIDAQTTPATLKVIATITVTQVD